MADTEDDRKHVSAQALPGPTDDVLGSLRGRVLRGALNCLAVAVPTLSLFVIVPELRRGALNGITIAISAYTLSFPLLRILSPRLGFRASALALLGVLAFTAFLVEARGGVGVGNIAVNVLVLLLSALFFGRRGAVVALTLVTALFALAGFLVVRGVVPPVDVALWDPRTAEFWIRQVAALVLFGVAIAVTELYVVEKLAREARRLEEQAAREHEQRLALERSEKERELEREQRLQAERALEESRRVEALARLAGGIAHDFNNGLTVILSSAELLEREAGSPQEIAARAREIIDAARRSGELTQQLLTLGHRQVSKPQAVRLRDSLSRAAAAFRRVLPADVALAVDLPGDDVVCRVDPTELERALLNLVLNSRDAMPRGGRLEIGCRTEVVEAGRPALAAGRYVVVSVTDTGEGIDEPTLARIFEPFFTTKAAGKGTGLGLATVYAFAKEAGGDVQVRSTKGAGTTFRLLLPESEASESARAPVPVRGTPETRLSSAPVLVVEDRDDVRAGMVRTLARGGFDVSEAADGDGALARLAQRNDFAVMCIDGVMPGLATSTVIERAKELAPAMRILLVSGHLQEDLLRRGIATGRYAFLAKPFSSEELLSSVRGLASSSGAAAEVVGH